MTTEERNNDPAALTIVLLEPGAAAVIRLGVELVAGACARNPNATLARLADVAARADEPFEFLTELIPSELLLTE